jgi:CMP-N-acetylneuraminic acid synthetase
MYHEIDGYLHKRSKTNFLNKQDLKKVYIRNGAFYVLKVSEFLREESFTRKPCKAYFMSDQESINIDGPHDLKVAQAFIGDLYGH